MKLINLFKKLLKHYDYNSTQISDEITTGVRDMTTEQAIRPTPETSGHRFERLARAGKVLAAVLALLYLINGTGAAAGYAKAHQTAEHDSAQALAEMVWVGVAWPVVLHHMMAADPLERVNARSDLDA